MTEKKDVDKEYVNSEVCQKCAKCCKAWWLYTYEKDDCIRASWLDTDLVSVKKVKEGMWKITFHIPCKQLIEKEGKYYCKVHKGNRPTYCKTYPLNFLEDDVEPEALELEKQFCPALKREVK